jgi:hypothetical protein
MIYVNALGKLSIGLSKCNGCNVVTFTCTTGACLNPTKTNSNQAPKAAATPIVIKYSTTRCGTSWLDANAKCGATCTLSCLDPGQSCYGGLTETACKPQKPKSEGPSVQPSTMKNYYIGLPAQKFTRLTNWQYLDDTANNNIWETNTVQNVDQCEALCKVGCDFYQFTPATSTCTLHYADKIARTQMYFVGQSNSNWMHGDLAKANLIQTYTGVTSGTDCLKKCSSVKGAQFGTWVESTNNPLYLGKTCKCYSFYYISGVILG